MYKKRDAPAETRKRSRRQLTAAIAAVSLFGFVVRTWGIGRESAWYDEVVTIVHLDAPDVGMFLERLAASGTPIAPVYFVMEYFWAHIVSDSLVGLRMLSALLGVLAIPAIFLFARRLYNTTAGCVAAFCLSASLVHIYFSQEIRMYAPIPLFTLISIYALLQGLHKGGWRWWVLNIVVNVALAWTHVFATLLLVAQAVWLLAFHSRKRRQLVLWMAAHSVVLLAYALWMRTLHLPRVYEAAGCIPETTIRDFVMAFLIFAGGRASNENPRAHLPVAFSLDQVLALFVFLLAAWCGWWMLRSAARAKDRVHFETLGLLLLWLLLPPALLLLLSWTWRPCFIYRYVLYSSLPLYILAGGAVATVPRKSVRALLICALVFLYGYQLSALTVGPFRADWRSVGQYVDQHAGPDDLVLVYQHINTVALEFNSDIPREQIETADVWSDICGPVIEACDQQRAVWLLVWLWSDPGNFESCFHANNLTYTTKDFESWPHVRVYHIEPQGSTGAD